MEGEATNAAEPAGEPMERPAAQHQPSANIPATRCPRDPAALLAAGSGVYTASYGVASASADLLGLATAAVPEGAAGLVHDLGRFDPPDDTDGDYADQHDGLVDFNLDTAVPGSLTATPQQSGTTAALVPERHGDDRCSRHHAEGDALRTGPTAVIDGELYIGSAKDANDAAACRAAGITAYLCAAGDLAADPLPTHARGGDSGGGASTAPTLLHLPLRDVATEPLAAHVPIACAFIDAQVAAGGRVLVYCQAGRSRSVSVVVAYVMRRRDINAEAALGDVRARYPRADPNMGFLLQLAELGGNDTCRDDDQGGEGSLLQLCDIGGA